MIRKGAGRIERLSKSCKSQGETIAKGWQQGNGTNIQYMWKWSSDPVLPVLHTNIGCSATQIYLLTNDCCAVYIIAMTTMTS